jgi:hypothetical protein
MKMHNGEDLYVIISYLVDEAIWEARDLALAVVVVYLAIQLGVVAYPDDGIIDSIEKTMAKS